MKTSFPEFIYSLYILAVDDRIRDLLEMMDLQFHDWVRHDMSI